MDRPLAGDLKMDIVMRLAELAAVLPDGAAGPADAKTVMAAIAEIGRLRAALETIYRVTDDEIAARFRTHHSKTEEEMAGKSVIYTMLSVPRNMARAALNVTQ